MQINPISLLDLNQRIKKIIKDNNDSYWVVAEISELKINYSGHCYIELIQKDNEKDQIVARSRATIWASTFRMIKPYFESTTKQSLREGIGVLVRVTIEFHEIYGLSLNIIDIEPTYTVGEMALRKQQVIEKLKEAYVFGMNKELELPELCRKIAVISSKTAAGFEDFEDQLLNNAYGYKFYVRLFPAIMQGDGSEKSIIAAMDQIFKYEMFFDCVVIIRGGGSQADLSCFNNYWLAYHITQFPLPVLTGIGHEQDDSVADLVAHTRLKTPTAVASFLIDKMAELHGSLKDIQEQLIHEVQNILKNRGGELSQIARGLQNFIKASTATRFNNLSITRHLLQNAVQRSVFRQNIALSKVESTLSLIPKKIMQNRFHNLDLVDKMMIRSLNYKIEGEKQKIEYFCSRIVALGPEAVLRRGYSITLKNNKVVKDSAALTEGDILVTIFHKGKIKSIFKKS